MSPENLGPNIQPTLEKARELFPDREDWIALQGGKPRVFRNPAKPHSAWLVVHVYEEHPDVTNRFRSGAIVPTIPPVGDIPMSRFTIERKDEEGGRIRRDIKIPSFMHRAVHGDACSERSQAIQKGSYDTVRNQEEYEELIERLRYNGFEELRFGLSQEGFALTALTAIRPTTPLGKNR